MKNENLQWITIAKGIGIILVVVGHYFPDDSPEYWVRIKEVIYTFHMPLFFMISGLLYRHLKYSYSSLIENKVKRLLYPFLTVAAIFLLTKWVSGFFVHIENPVTITNVLALFFDPVHSFMPLLWFVWTLFLIFLIYPLARILINNNYVLLLFSVCLSLVVYQGLLGLDKLISNFPYFIFGVLLREQKKLEAIAASGRLISLVVFAMLFIILFSMTSNAVLWANYDIENWVVRFANICMGITGALFVINLSKLGVVYASLGVSNAVAQVGIYSMSIYLFHTLFESGVRITGTQLLRVDLTWFIWLAMVAICAGILIPMLIEKYVLRRFNVTKKYILGLS